VANTPTAWPTGIARNARTTLGRSPIESIVQTIHVDGVEQTPPIRDARAAIAFDGERCGVTRDVFFVRTHARFKSFRIVPAARAVIEDFDRAHRIAHRQRELENRNFHGPPKNGGLRMKKSRSRMATSARID